MTVTKLTCTKKGVASIELPKGFIRQPIVELNIKDTYTNKYIQGFVAERWDLQYRKKLPYLLKLVVDEQHGRSSSSAIQAITVFCFNKTAKEMDQVHKGDLVVIAGFSVETSTRATVGHPCQLCVDNDDAQIWIVKVDGKMGESTSSNRSLSSNNINQPQPKKGRTVNYEYATIDRLQPNTCVSLYAVVKFCKAPYRTRGTDLCQVLSVVDPTCEPEMKLKCLFFIRPPAEAPPVKVGSIVRFHRLKVINHNGALQGNNGPGFSWLVFEGLEGGSLTPSASSVNYTFSDQDKQKVEELRCWAANRSELNEHGKNTNLADIVPGKYSNVTVQVVSTCPVEADVCFLLKVWDGTKSIYPVREVTLDEDNTDIDTNTALHDVAQGFLYDICLFDDHFKTGRSIKPGDFVELRNLHAAVYKNAETREEYMALQTVELVVHRGTSYGRGVLRLAPSSTEVLRLTKRLDEIKKKVQSREETNQTENRLDEEVCHGGGKNSQMPAGNSKNQQMVLETDNSVIKSQDPVLRKEPVLVLEKLSDNELSTTDRKKRPERTNQNEANNKRPKDALEQEDYQSVESEFLNTGSSPELQLSCDPPSTPPPASSVPHEVNRCMMDTATVLTAHQHTKVTRLAEVIAHKVPYKFRVLAKLADYQPKLDRPEQLIRLYCSTCHHLASPSDEEGVSLQYMMCPRCIEGSASLEMDETSSLEFTYMVKFLLDDGRDWIVANLWRKHATEFFRGIKPEEALQDEKLFKMIKEDMERLLGDDQSKPWLECCVMSYTGQSGPCYQIFETTLV